MVNRFLGRAALVACMAVILSVPGRAQTADPAPADQATAKESADAAKDKDIRRLLELTGASKLGIQVMNQLIGTFKQLNPEVPDEFWDGFMKQVNAEDIVNLTVPIYAKHFTHDEIMQMIQFYESPVGKKVTRELPQIFQESTEAGRRWGADMARKVTEQLRAKGYQKA